MWKLCRRFSSTKRIRFGDLYIPTRNDTPADAVLNSHKLLVQGGFTRMTAGKGLYTILPLGLRVISKIESVIDEELQNIGCSKLEMPLLLEKEDWVKSGRWTSSGEELFKVQDRHKRDYCLAPTHEEAITSLVAEELTSFRQLPLRLYQIGKKYRDEIRPRFGLLRSREFLMKDLYTFDVDQSSAFRTYDAVNEAYFRIFRRLALDVVRVDADSGNIGGNRSHEFQLLSAQGFDDLLRCAHCAYAANVEKAVSRIAPAPAPATTPVASSAASREASARTESSDQRQPLQSSRVWYPDAHVSALVSAALDRVQKDARVSGSGLSLDALIKGEVDVACHVVSDSMNCVAFILTPPGREVQLLSLKDSLGWKVVESLSGDQAARACASVSLEAEVKMFIDCNIFATSPQSDLLIGHYSIAKANDGCPCAGCQGLLQSSKGIEVGHVFYLGKKYSKTLGAKFLTANQTSEFAEMGCFGIGLTRIMAAAAEANHDTDGLLWPEALAPYRAVILSTEESHNSACEALYDQIALQLPAFRQQVVLDDRDFREFRFGKKIRDALLIGFPWIIVGGKSLSRGLYEVRHRATGKKMDVGPAEILELLKGSNNL